MKKTQIQSETPFMDPTMQASWRKFYLLIGPPGCGKTQWARQLANTQGLWHGAKDVHNIWRASGLDSELTMGQPDEQGNRGPRYSRMFRAPHHSVSLTGMTGRIHSGWFAQPGELSLAHGGVLLLDELPEFQHDVLTAVLYAIQTGSVLLRTGTGDTSCNIRIPACFSLVASMNPCPCGWHEAGRHACKCTADQIARHRARAAEFEEFCEVIDFAKEQRTAVAFEGGT